jgi:hypothetical protein
MCLPFVTLVTNLVTSRVRKVGMVSTCDTRCHSCCKPGDVTNEESKLIRDVTRFVTRVTQLVPHVLTLPTFLIRDVTRFVTSVAQRVPHVLILPSLLLHTW